MPNLRRTAGLTAVAAALLAAAPRPARASIVAPPEPAEVESLFREACWAGLRVPAAFRRALQSSTLDLQPVEDQADGERYEGRASSVHYLPGDRCTIRAHLRGLEAAEEIVRRIGGFVPLEAVAAAEAEAEGGGARAYRSPPRVVDGGRVGVELDFVPPAPPRTRIRPMYPPSFTLAISVYFAPDE